MFNDNISFARTNIRDARIDLRLATVPIWHALIIVLALRSKCCENRLICDFLKACKKVVRKQKIANHVFVVTIALLQ